MLKTLDEKQIYGAYQAMDACFYKKLGKNKLPKKKAIEQIEIVKDNVSKIIYYLQDSDLPVEVKQKKMMSAKGTYIQFLQVKATDKTLINSVLVKQIDSMLELLSCEEAKDLLLLKTQEIAGDKIDLSTVFVNTKNVNKLGSKLVRDIVKEYIFNALGKENATYVGAADDSYYITETGSKYHIKDCPFCKRNTLFESTKTKVVGLGLEPCKCVKDLQNKRKADWENYVTVFIDESIYHVGWDKNGNDGKQGNYSYIICKGKLSSEDEILPGNIITQGVEVIDENHSTDRLTKFAIGKCLMYLAYDYSFNGIVQIYTDNMAAMKQWNANNKNAAIADLFKGVKVNHIKREYNKKADALGHTRTVIDVPAEVYNQIHSKVTAYDLLMHSFSTSQKRLRYLEEKEKKLNAQIEEYESQTLWAFIQKRYLSNFSLKSKKGLIPE